MKRIIFILTIFLSTLAVALPQDASAKVKHHKRHHVVRTVSAAPRSHGLNLNGNVGVGVGPVHVGVGAGAGVGVH